MMAHWHIAENPPSIRAARIVVNRIKDKQNEARATALIGKFFKYRNCYSCPEKPSDYWYLYRAVSGQKRDGALVGWDFQQDKYGAITIKALRHEYALSMGSDSGWREIERKEFIRAFQKKVVNKVNALKA